MKFIQKVGQMSWERLTGILNNRLKMKLYLKNNPTIDCIECTPEELRAMLCQEVHAFNNAVEEIADICLSYVLLVD
jgi:hypothetical protein